MCYEETFQLNRVLQIKTIVTADEKEIEQHLSTFMCPSNNLLTQVIGFDAEWFLAFGNGNEVETRCATIALCDGNMCLIIQYYRLARHSCWGNDLAHKSLLNFFHQPNIAFVGVGIKENFARFEKLSGIACRNAVELGTLAAKVKREPRLSFCGVDELAIVVSGLCLREHRHVTSAAYDYVCNPLNKELAKLAAVNVYSYFKIGCTLLRKQF